MAKDRVQITTYVSRSVAEQLEEMAREQDRSLASLLRIGLHEIIERENAKRTRAERDEVAA